MTKHKIVIGDSRKLNKIPDKSVQLINYIILYIQFKLLYNTMCIREKRLLFVAQLRYSAVSFTNSSVPCINWELIAVWHTHCPTLGGVDV